MKPFNLEAAKAGASVVTRSGFPVRLLAFDIVGLQPIAGVVTFTTGQGLNQWDLDGAWSNFHGPSGLDLFMASTKQKRYVAICRWDAGFTAAATVPGGINLGKTPEEAVELVGKYHTGATILAVVPVEWEE